jgi:hypothetical protein
MYPPGRIPTFLSRFLPRAATVALLTLGAVSCSMVDGGDDSADDPDVGTNGDATPVALGGGDRARPVQRRDVDMPESGAHLGWGWNALAEEPVPSVCVAFGIAEGLGQTKHMTMREVSDSYEVMNSMDMSASMSVKTIGYKVSGKAAFAKTSQVTGFNSTFVLNVSIANSARYAAPIGEGAASVAYDADGHIPDTGEIRLTPTALRLAERRDLTAFYNRCGHAFVSAVHGGAKLYAIITIAVTSQEEQERISAQMKGGGYGVAVNSNFNSVTGSTEDNEDVSMRFYQLGGRGDTIPKTQDDLKGKLDDLARLAAEAPKEFSLTLTPYTALANWPDRPIDLDPSEYDELASYWGSYNSLYEEMQLALDNPRDFHLYTQEDAGRLSDDPAAIKQLERDQDEVQAILVALSDDAALCSQPDRGCRFDQSRYPSPYAYRVRLPIGGAASSSDARVDGKRALVAYHVRDPSNRRCEISPVNDGCLSNSEIDDWYGRIGKAVMRVDDGEVLNTLVTQHPEITLAADSATPVWYDVERDTPLIWYDVAGEDEVKALIVRLGAKEAVAVD